MCKCVLYYCHWVSTQLQLTNISVSISSSCMCLVQVWVGRLISWKLFFYIFIFSATAHKWHSANSEFVKGLQSFAVDKLLLKTTETFSFLYSLFFIKLFISVFFIVSLFWFVKKFFNWCQASVGLRKWTYRPLVADSCLVLLERWNQGIFGQNT